MTRNLSFALFPSTPISKTDAILHVITINELPINARFLIELLCRPDL